MIGLDEKGRWYKKKSKEIDNLHRQLGKSTAEVDFLTKKLKSLD